MIREAMLSDISSTNDPTFILSRTFDANYLDELLNDPEIRPFAGDEGDHYISLSEAIIDKNNIFLECDGGGFIYYSLGKRVYEVHCFFLNDSRGKYAYEAGQHSLGLMFQQYNAKKIVAHIPIENKRTQFYAIKSGFKFERNGKYSLNNKEYKTRNYSINKKEWNSCHQQ